MIQAYIEDSVGGRFFVLVAMIASADTWIRFSDEWREALNAYPPITYFRMAECYARGGQFASFSVSDRDKKLELLKQIIGRHDIRAIRCMTDIHAFNGIIKGKISKTMDSPLFVTATELMRIVVQEQSKIDTDESVDFIFDDGSNNYFREIRPVAKVACFLTGPRVEVAFAADHLFSKPRTRTPC